MRKAHPEATYCLFCLDEVGGLKSRAGGDLSHVGRYVDSHAKRVAARMIAWEDSPTNTGRERMRGGKRGRKSIGDENEADLRDMVRFVANAVRDMAEAESAEVKMKGPIQRESARQQACGWALLLVRTGIELCKRNGVVAEQADHNIAGLDDSDET